MIFPDEHGLAFSGSAWVDYKNDSGLGNDDHPPILLFYTAAGNYSKLSEGKLYTQCLYYSVDGGQKFVKYENNPIIKHIANENRDPKVNFAPEINKYIMALYLEDNRFMLLSSGNLLDWQPLQEITELDDIECPDFYSLPVINGDGERKWIFSSISHKYLVGDFINGKFVPCQKARSLHFGFQRRATQTFSGMDNDRRVCASWDPVYMPGEAFKCQIGTPIEISLEKDKEGYFLCANPISEISTLYKKSILFTQINISKDKMFSHVLERNAYDITLDFENIDATTFSIKLFGAQIDIDLKDFVVKYKESVIEVQNTQSLLSMRIISDKCTTEIYVGNGRYYACNEHHAEYSDNRLTLSTNGNVQVNTLHVHSLESIWG